MTLMKKSSSLVVATVLAIVLVGCASQKITEADDSPAHAYHSYRLLNDNGASLEELSGLWDEAAQDMFLRTTDSSGSPIAIDNFESSLRYPQLFSDIPEIPEAIATDGDKSCLLIVGPASDGGILALSVLLTKENRQWHHSELFARYLETDEPLPKKPSCVPPEPFSS